MYDIKLYRNRIILVIIYRGKILFYSKQRHFALYFHLIIAGREVKIVEQ